MDHIHFMKEALLEAQQAYRHDEVPIGAIIVYKNEIIARASNLRETKKSPIAHAEILALEKAAQYLGTWNLSECILYVSVEPCPMCAGAILQAQLGCVVFGLREPNSGSFGSVINLANEKFNHKPLIISDIMAEESKQLMTDYFKEKRQEMIKVRALKSDEVSPYFEIRKIVFVDEQAVDLDLEYDEYDDANHPLVTAVGAFKNDKMVGTMRLVKKDWVLKVGRLAVLLENRKDKVGSALLNYAQKQAENNGFDTIELGAQVSAIPFYEKNGYEAYGPVFLDADIDHKMMRKIITKR